MKRRPILIVLVGALGVLLLVAAFAPVGNRIERYRPVDSSAAADELLHRSPPPAFERPVPHMVDGGRLHLLVETQHSAFITKRVRRNEWTASQIRAFRDLHPELERYWPEPERDDGGAPWAGGAWRPGD